MPAAQDSSNRPRFVDVAEQKRLNDARELGIPWKQWGPYLSERQWGTVREDYSEDGNAWAYFSHDESRSRAYRWGEDGLGGISDDRQRLCFALALWNGRDPILKERAFGLTNSEGNHGEDVKEYYFYVDSTPTHSYMKYLYKYPQREYPYRDLVETNQRRTKEDFEYELIDTGAFDEGRYFDVFVEYAKAALTTSSCASRCTTAAPRRHGCTCCRRSGSAIPGPGATTSRSRPCGKRAVPSSRRTRSSASTRCRARGVRSCCSPRTRATRSALWEKPNATPYVKDAFHRYVVSGERDAVNPAKAGTKATAHYVLDVPAGGSAAVRLRLEAGPAGQPFDEVFEQVFQQRVGEADEFYRRIAPPSFGEDERRVHRQALAGMLWTKQYYHFDVDRWLKEHDAHPLMGAAKRAPRNAEWFHMLNGDVLSMPDKWEYPWYAAWDLAFHTIALSLVDFDFAKEQLLLLLKTLYSHPNGQIPAYEWNFSDVNPPVHAWATLFLHKMEKNLGREDIPFLKRSFQGLMLNFNWWVNRKDPQGRNVFAGGFLGLDNIGVFDRSAQLPTGGSLEQADGTAWMAFYCQNMLEIALILADKEPIYEEVAFKFLENFIWIAYAMDKVGEHGDDMWDEQDGFYYDVLRLPDGQAFRLKVRSMVGLLPLCASTVFEPDVLARHPKLMELIALFVKRYPQVVAQVAPTTEGFKGYGDRRLLSPLTRTKLRRILVVRPGREGVPWSARHPVGFALPRRSSVRLPHGRPGAPRGLPACRVEHRDVRRQLELAGAGLDAGQHPARPRAHQLLRVLRGRLHNRVPDGIRPADDAVRGGERDRAAARRPLPA